MIALFVLIALGVVVFFLGFWTIFLDFDLAWTFLIVGIGMGMIFGGVVPLAEMSHNRHVEHCHEKGGHIHHLYRDYVCLSPDGRII